MQCALAIVVFTANILVTVHGARYPSELNVGTNGAPGAHVGLTEAFLDYLSNIVEEIGNKQVKNMKVDRMARYYDEGAFIMTNLRVKDLRKPERYDLSFVKGSEIELKVTKMDIELEGDSETHYKKFKAEGPATASVEDMTVTVRTKLIQNKDSTLGFKLSSCKTEIGSLKMDTSRLKGTAVKLLKTYKKILNSMATDILEGETCKNVNKFMLEALTEMLGKEFAKSSLPGAELKRRRGGAKRAKAIEDLNLEHYLINYALTESPSTSNTYLDLKYSGEISYLGQGGTPFHPKKFSSFDSSASKKMVYAKISDYIFNSFLYNAYDQNTLEIRMNSETVPGLNTFLGTKCRRSDCIGSLFPDKTKKLSRQDKVEIKFDLTEMPLIRVKKGKIIMEMNGDLDIVAAPKEDSKTSSRRSRVKTIASGSAKAEGEIQLKIEDQAIVGTIKLEDMEVSVKKEVNDKLSERLTSVVNDIINTELIKEIPLPAFGGLGTLKNPALAVNDEEIELQSDVEVDKTKIAKLLQQAIDEKLG